MTIHSQSQDWTYTSNTYFGTGLFACPQFALSSDEFTNAGWSPVKKSRGMPRESAPFRAASFVMGNSTSTLSSKQNLMRCYYKSRQYGIKGVQKAVAGYDTKTSQNRWSSLPAWWPFWWPLADADDICPVSKSKGASNANDSEDEFKESDVSSNNGNLFTDDELNNTKPRDPNKCQYY